MTAISPSQWASTKSIGDAFADKDVDKNGFSEEQWAMVQKLAEEHRIIRAVKDSCEALFSPAQWSVLKDMVQGCAEGHCRPRKEDKMAFLVFKDRILDILVQKRVFFSPTQWAVAKDMVAGTCSAQSVKDDSNTVLTPAQLAVVKAFIDGTTSFSDPFDIAASFLHPQNC